MCQELCFRRRKYAIVRQKARKMDEEKRKRNLWGCAEACRHRTGTLSCPPGAWPPPLFVLPISITALHVAECGHEVQSGQWDSGLWEHKGNCPLCSRSDAFITTHQQHRSSDAVCNTNDTHMQRDTEQAGHLREPGDLFLWFISSVCVRKAFGKGY